MISRWLGNLLNKYKEQVQQEVVDKIASTKGLLCSHEYKLTKIDSTDALGIPYGYRYYKCQKCGNEKKEFWYV